jgi:outer membrane protein assembly factor BamB
VASDESTRAVDADRRADRTSGGHTVRAFARAGTARGRGRYAADDGVWLLAVLHRTHRGRIFPIGDLAHLVRLAPLRWTFWSIISYLRSVGRIVAFLCRDPQAPIPICGSGSVACAVLVGLALIGGWSHRVAAQSTLDQGPVVTVEEIDQAGQALLEQARQFVLARKWPEAVDMMRRVMEGHADRLVYVPDTDDAPLRRYVPMRLFGALELRRWGQAAPALLEYYQSVVAGRAERLWERVEREHDIQALRELVENYFLTPVGAQAALLWGELLLEQGRTVQARGWWERLHPAMRTPPGVHGLPAGRPLWLFLPETGPPPTWLQTERFSTDTSYFLSHPQTTIPLADLRARAVLVSLWEGHQERLRRERNLFQQQFADVTGVWAGRSAPWTELFDMLSDQTRSRPALATTFSQTFAGTPQRNAVVARRPDPGGPPLWQVRLPRLVAGDDRVTSTGRPRIAEADDGILAYFPVVVGQTVWVAQANGVRALDLWTGRAAFGSSATVADSQENEGLVFSLAQPSAFAALAQAPYFGVPRYTLTAHGHLLWARLGTAVTRGPQLAEYFSGASSKIVALDATAQGRLVDGYPLEPPGPEWTFEGTPLTDGERLFVAMRKQDDIRAEAAIAAYDLNNGRLLWIRSICFAETPGQGRWNERTHNLLTLHQGTLYYNTNMGVVAAVDSQSGTTLWTTQYPRVTFASAAQRDLGHFYRSLNPVLVHQDMLLVAPADCDRIFALDAFTGQKLWCTESSVAADAVHLLGVVGNMFILSGDYLYWLDVHTGRLHCQFPPPASGFAGYARPSPRGYGRGLLTDQTIVWPTREAIYFFHVQPTTLDGVPMPQPSQAPRPWSWFGVQPGNLVAAADVLLVAGATELSALRW